MPSAFNNLNKVFDRYLEKPSRDNPAPDRDKISVNRFQNYLSDLNVEPDEPLSLAVMEIVKCKAFGEAEREDFVAGWQTTSRTNTSARALDNIPAQSNHMTALRQSLSTDKSFFKTVYRYSFGLLKPDIQRGIPPEMAPDCWRMFFTGDKGGMEWPLLGDWLEFYDGPYKRKPVVRDMWNQVAEMAFKTMEPGGETLDWWSEESAWPAAIDEFVAWMKERVEKMDTT
ncbi:MAG: hypothetical protein Q9227_009115 [Pyrenula ochraceoflavens]